MKKPNLSQIRKWAKDHKGIVIGMTGIIAAEIGFLFQGINDGVEKGANAGADYVLKHVKEIDSGTYETLRDKMIKDGCEFYD